MAIVEKRVTAGVNYTFIMRNYLKSMKLIEEEELTGVPSNRVRGIGLEGASRTGKTWDICMFICWYVNNNRCKQVSICRDYFATLRKTIYETLKTVWGLWGMPLDVFNKTASDIVYRDNTIRFVGINDNIMTAHGLESDVLIINEAMGIAKATADQLEQRTKEFFIYDYNPSATSSWLFDLEKRTDYKLKKTTIFDNPYAPKNARKKILSYAHPDSDDLHIAIKAGFTEAKWHKFKERNVLNGTADKFMWEVYGLGFRTVSENLIFKGIDIYYNEPEGDDWVLYGGDFGYKNDPTALVRVTKSGRNLYLRQYIYSTGLLNGDIAELMLEQGLDDQISVWDSAEQKSIEELRKLDIPADGAEKGPNSIAYGIQLLQQYRIFVHVDSVDLKAEFDTYQWAKDRQGEFKRNVAGNRVPVDKDNHAIDAVRYAVTYYADPLDRKKIDEDED